MIVVCKAVHLTVSEEVYTPLAVLLQSCCSLAETAVTWGSVFCAGHFKGTPEKCLPVHDFSLVYTCSPFLNTLTPVCFVKSLSPLAVIRSVGYFPCQRSLVLTLFTIP